MQNGKFAIRKIFTPAFYALFNYTNVNHLLMHLLLNSQEHNTIYTTVKALTENTGLSTRTIRTCIAKLINSGDISLEGTNKYSVFSLLKYDDYIIKPMINDKPFFYKCTCSMCHRKRSVYEGKLKELVQ